MNISVASLDGSGVGPVVVGNNCCLKLNAVDFEETPSFGKLVTLTFAGADTSDWWHKGRLYNAADCQVTESNGVAIDVTVLGVASAVKLVHGGDGLYKAVAQFGDGYYATFQDAINARGGGSGDITVLDASAPIPFGYKVFDGKLVRSRKIIFEFR